MFTEGKEDKKKRITWEFVPPWISGMCCNIFILSVSDELSNLRVDNGLFGLPKLCVCII